MAEPVQPEAGRRATATRQLHDERVDLLGGRGLPDGVVLDVKRVRPAVFGLLERERGIEAVQQTMRWQGWQACILRPRHSGQRFACPWDGRFRLGSES